MKVSMEGTGPGTTVGVNVALTGTLKDQNDISIFGMVEGEVISDTLVVVGETAQIKGPIKGKIVTIAGTVRGEVEASEKLELLATGKVYGGIATRNLIVHSGAFLVGKSSMIGVEEEQVETKEEAVSQEANLPEPDKE